MSNTKRGAIRINGSMQQRDLHLAIGELFAGLPAEDLGGFDRSAYLRTSLLSKYANPDRDSEAERERAAIAKLLSVEVRNERTEHRLRFKRGYIGGKHTSSLMFTASAIIKDVLGDFDIEELFVRSDFSNGASVSRLRKVASKFEKFDGSSAISRKALPYLHTLIKASPLVRTQFLYEQCISGKWLETDTNILFTVPKNESINRCAAKEPDWNMFFQKGLGSMIRKRLKNKGIDLNDQTKNQELAKVGSYDSSLATLDLSSASDSVTSELVYQLLPSDWFKHLDNLRSPLCKFPDGSVHKWRLFSTMGNGFTFELESLIFYALSKAICYHFGVKGTVSVYGDDIIVPVKAAPLLVDFLGYCGFITNKDKSFITGFFRESCGEHYFKGINVTPIYIRKPLTLLTDLVGFINKFRKWSGRNCTVCDPRHFEFLEKLESYIPNRILPLIKGGGNMDQGSHLCGPGSRSHRIALPQKSVKISGWGAYTMWMYLVDTGRPQEEARKGLPSVNEVLRVTAGSYNYYSDRVGFSWFPQELRGHRDS